MDDATPAPYDTILVERRGRVGLITLNRPKALNALNRQLMEEVTRAAAAFDQDAEVGCLLLTGSEKAFAAGADIKEMAGATAVDMFIGDAFAGWDALTRVRKPIVAAVSGFALGGGCELAMMCDMIIASETAKFGQPEVKLGIIPGIGGSQRLIRAIGKAKATDMCLTGRMMDAAEAERSGLVARVVPSAELMTEALENGRDDRIHVAARRHDHQGVPRPRSRDSSRGRAPLRTPRVPCPVLDRGPERGDGGLRREARPAFPAPLTNPEHEP